jgi:hypothetical protein
VRAITDGGAVASSGVAHAGTLVAFADAAVAGERDALEKARRDVLQQLGPDALVDAAAVVGNFQRMVRIADSTGIPLDTPMELLSEDLRDELGVERFGSSANTPPNALRSAVGRVAGPLARAALRLYGRQRRRG